MRAEYGAGEHGVTREIAITLVREPGNGVDMIRPKRTGVGITFETDPIDNSARVKRLIRGSPADRSGMIKAGDVLTHPTPPTYMLY